MPFELKPSQGSLFVNDKKGDNEKAPNLKGRALLQLPEQFGNAVIELDLAGWTRTTKDGKKWLSLSVKPKNAPRQQSVGSQHSQDFVARNGTPLDQDEDIPFVVPFDLDVNRKFRV